MRYLAVAVALLLTGCGTATGVMKALAKDPATACVTVTSIYGVARIYRTAAPNARVQCTQDGMTVESWRLE